MIQKRREAMEELNELIQGTQEWLDDVLTDLGWTQGHLLQKDEDFKQCPYDPNHKMPESSLEKHIRICPYLRQGYTRHELESRFPEGASNSKIPDADTIPLDDETYFRIVNAGPGRTISGSGSMAQQRPLTHERATVDLNREKRAALYRYCVETAKARNRCTSFPEDQLMLLEDQKSREDTKGMSDLERKAYERDLKRRRQSYKGKSTHTSKKSHYEILRDLIGNQMDIVTQMWGPAEPATKDVTSDDKVGESSQTRERPEEDKETMRDDGRRREIEEVKDEPREVGERVDRYRSVKIDERESRSSSKGRSRKHKKHHKHKSKKSKSRKEYRSRSRDRSRDNSPSPGRSGGGDGRRYKEYERSVDQLSETTAVVVKSEPQDPPEAKNETNIN